jgi:hypothetical protein
MFEVGIISIIVLAVGYWVTLWLMSRHDDVLHGDFVHTERGAKASSALRDPPFPVKPPFPPKPATKRSAGPAAAVNPLDVKPVVVKPVPTETLPAPTSTTPVFSERSDTLQTLLASIKQDLKDASQL